MEILLFLPVLLVAVVVHEVAHAQVAKWEGDDTADRRGRITLNPIPHLDLWGSLIVPVALYLTPGSFIFGWAKPVPVDPSNFRSPKWGDIRVSLAGITANLILAFLCTLALVPIILLQPESGALTAVFGAVGDMAEFGIFINLILGVFNLIPIPPLDGSHVVYQLLPRAWGERYREFGRYGILVLLGALVFAPGAFRVLLWPVRALMGAADAFIGLWI